MGLGAPESSRPVGMNSRVRGSASALRPSLLGVGETRRRRVWGPGAGSRVGLGIRRSGLDRFSPPRSAFGTFHPPLGGRPASRGPLRFLLKPDNRSPRYSGRDEAGGLARGRRLEGHRAALLGSLGAGAAGLLGGAAPERPWASGAVGRVVFGILRKSALFVFAR